jgi:hypothetical protein
MTREDFAKGMYKLEIGLDRKEPFPPESAEVYWERLASLTPAEWELAVNFCLDNCRFFPKIVDLLEAAQAGRPGAEEIWGRLLVAAEDGGDLPEWVDEPTKKALLATGGWDAFCVTNYEELRFFFKPFKEVYQVARKQEQALRVEGPEAQRSIS